MGVFIRGFPLDSQTSIRLEQAKKKRKNRKNTGHNNAMVNNFTLNANKASF